MPPSSNSDKTKRWEELARIAKLKAEVEQAKEQTAERVLEASQRNRDQVEQSIKSSLGHYSQKNSYIGKGSLSNATTYAASLTAMLHQDKPRHEQLQRQRDLQKQHSLKWQVRAECANKLQQNYNTEAEKDKTKQVDQETLELVVNRNQFEK